MSKLKFSFLCDFDPAELATQGGELHIATYYFGKCAAVGCSYYKAKLHISLKHIVCIFQT